MEIEELERKLLETFPGSTVSSDIELRVGPLAPCAHCGRGTVTNIPGTHEVWATNRGPYHPEGDAPYVSHTWDFLPIHKGCLRERDQQSKKAPAPKRRLGAYGRRQQNTEKT